jgi:AraC-like DNA-binding protein
MKADKSPKRLWLVLEGEGVSSNLIFLCKHDWNVRHVLTPHAHSAHEFIYIVGGEGEINSNDVDYCLGKGDLLLVEPESVHKGTAHPENPFELLTLGYNFGADRVYADPALFGLDSIFLELYLAYKRKIKAPLIHNCERLQNVLFNLLDETIDNQRCRKELMRAYLIQFFTFLIRKLEPKIESDSASPDVAEAIIKAKKHIQSHFHEPIVLEDIAQVACLSQSHFCRLFKQETGFTPIEYLNSVRLEYAKTLLLYSNYTLTEIADRVGFSSIHYFSRCFKKYEGVSPLYYRQTESTFLNRSAPAGRLLQPEDMDHHELSKFL